MFLLLFLSLAVPLLARVECFYVVGHLKCPADPGKAARVRIDLMDEDPLPLEEDDTLGRTWSSPNGSFAVTGCGSDFGPFNTPDGYLRIFHSCPGKSSRRELQLDILPIFLPHIVDLGSVYLDRYIDED